MAVQWPQESEYAKEMSNTKRIRLRSVSGYVPTSIVNIRSGSTKRHGRPMARLLHFGCGGGYHEQRLPDHRTTRPFSVAPQRERHRRHTRRRRRDGGDGAQASVRRGKGETADGRSMADPLNAVLRDVLRLATGCTGPTCLEPACDSRTSTARTPDTSTGSRSGPSRPDRTGEAA